MARLVKILLIGIAAFVGIFVLAAVSLLLFFDPNDFREDISAAVKDATGRELVIEGDLSLSIFPWVAVDIGRTQLGNAEGFGDDPMLSFEGARLSVRLVPLIFKQEIAVGTASLDSLTVNLAVNKSGVTNWDDLTSEGETADAPVDTEEAGGMTGLDIANISVTNANVTYRDMQAGSTTSITGLNFNTGRVAAGSPFDIEAEFGFDSRPDAVGGNLAFSGTFLVNESMEQIDIDGLNISGELRGIAEEATPFNFDARAINVDTAAERMTLGEMDMSILGISMSANVEPFSYAGDPMPKASLTVHEFSLKDLMRALGTEVPETADPNAMTRVSFTAKANVGPNDVALNDIKIQMDDTTMSGTLSLPKTETGAMKFDLNVDAIVVDHYMAPASDAPEEEVADEGSSNVEIPTDLIRALNVDGKFTMARATLSGMEFENMLLTVKAKDGRLRMHPISADMFGGSYKGDIRIDASNFEPILEVNENIVGVQLSSLAKAMYDVDNINGSINGQFVLAGRGADTDSIQKTLKGTVSFALKDGAYIGTDIWHELRVARARLRQETPPEPRLPARTEFSSVTATGSVTEGVLTNNDFLAELPFLRLTGRGTVSFVEGSVNYSMNAAVQKSPELAGEMSEAEIKDFTSVTIPLKATGPLADPSIQVDVEALLKKQVEQELEKRTDEIKDKLLKGLFGGGDDDEDTGDEDRQ